MVKRIGAVIVALGLLAAAVPQAAGAAQPNGLQGLLQQRIAGLQQQLNVEDPAGLNAVTIEFLDEILAAGLADDNAGLQLAVLRYVSRVQEFQEALALDNETSCLVSFGISAGSAAIGMITELTSGNSAFCMVNNLSNKAADILIANCKYQICLIDTAGATGDRAALVAQWRGLALYNFSTSAVNVFVCTPAPGFQDYLSLVFDLIGIFSAK